ncbi:MAG: STAS domain-containing protein [Rhizobium rhizophilum]|uniref:STAS domain-containing protein n=1 Tax=Rhizobium rhizophilum TaxID=1850373 RepID=UPI00391DBD70
MSEDLKTVHLEGALTIKTATETHGRLVSAYREAKAASGALEIDIADDCDCDLTLPQLLLSAQETAAREGVELRIRASADGALFATLERAGISAATNSASLLTINGDQR